jgi:acyl-coenzyme A synthetase/AMP-(fatty) acid ligase
VRADSVRAQRYQRRFAQTHAFLPARNGIRPDTLHVCLHAVVLAIVVMLAMLTLGKFSSSM